MAGGWKVPVASARVSPSRRSPVVASSISFPDRFERPMQATRAAATRSLAAKSARALFVLYAVFMLLGPAPLQDDDEVSDMTQSNVVNQIVDSLVPAMAVLCLLPRRRQLW